MASLKPDLFRQPFRWMRYHAYTKPAIFYSMVIGAMGPVILFGAPPIRHYFGDTDIERIPLTYPVPTGPRKVLEGYDDE